MNDTAGRSGGSPANPNVDHQGHLELHCTQCGAALDASSQFCTVCSAEVSGGDAAATSVES
jgi:predicted amidophosphoribosyltransferase